MATGSSPGRRPFGNPAGSQPARPRFSAGPWALSTGGSKHVAAESGFWFARRVAGTAVLSRVASNSVALITLTLGTPFKNAATRSARGYVVGASAPVAPNTTSTRIGSDGFVT